MEITANTFTLMIAVFMLIIIITMVVTWLEIRSARSRFEGVIGYLEYFVRQK